MSEGHGEGSTLEYTPTWVVAAVCTVIVGISLAAERLLHYTGEYLKKKNQNPLYEALQKVKEELMLLGFISLMLTAFQGSMVKICVPADAMEHLLPCLRHSETPSVKHNVAAESSPHYHRRLFEIEAPVSGYCTGKNKVPMLSLEALHHLHIFIFVLAIVHVSFSVLTVVFGGAKIRQWKHWEDSIAKDNYDMGKVLKRKITHTHQIDVTKKRVLGLGKHSVLLNWLHCFGKQFYGSVTKSDYAALRLGFIMTHCRGNPKFNFHNYMIRALEDDFKIVVGISWYLWVFVIIFLFLNFNGWHTYFWMAFLPFFLLLVVGTKLEHVITQLTHEVTEKHILIEDELVHPSDNHFWLHRPYIILYLIHFILFQNAFEIAFFFWIWLQYGFRSCIMGQVRYIVPRLIMGVFIQVMCSYSTLPPYALVTQMGTHFKKSIFEEHVQVGLHGWAEKAKNGLKAAVALEKSTHEASSTTSNAEGSHTIGIIQMGGLGRQDDGPPPESPHSS